MIELGKLIDDIVSDRLKAPPIIKASVVNPPPNLTIDVMGEIIPSEQIYCSNYLLPHYHRDYKIDGVIDSVDITVDNYDYNNNTQDVMGHKIPKLNGKGQFTGNGVYKSHKDLWFEDTLKKGDEVLVLIMGIFYVVVTKITKMPNGAVKGV